jgi:hypothetical protein
MPSSFSDLSAPGEALPPPIGYGPRLGPVRLDFHQLATRAARRTLRGPPTSAGPSAAVSAGLPSDLGAQQISQGKSLRFRGDPVANTPAAPTGIGLRCHEPAHPASGRLTALHLRSRPPRTYGFLQTRPHGSPPTPNHSADRPPVNSGPCPCLIDVGFPLSGPQDRTSTSDLKRHAWHTRPVLTDSILTATGPLRSWAG